VVAPAVAPDLQLAAPLAPGMYDARIAAMHRRQRPAQPVRIRRYEDQVNVVRHQAPRPELNPGSAAGRREQIAIEPVVVVAEKRPRPAVAALRHVVRQSGNDNAGKTAMPDSMDGGWPKSI